MATRALIIGKTKDGLIKYGQTHWDGYQNTEWLKKNMTDIEKIENMFDYMTTGEDGGHGISSLSYENYDTNKPKINWYEDSYNCGVTNHWNCSYDDLNRIFDFPEYISYWDGSDWHDFEIDGKTYGEFLKMTS